MSEEAFAAALARAQDWVGEIEGVTAVGEGQDPDGTPVIDVWITSDAGTDDIPDEVEGHPVRVRESGGPITAQ